MVNNFSWSLDIAHADSKPGAHYSKNWNKEKQSAYNKWYYEHVTKKLASDLEDKDESGTGLLKRVGQNISDTVLDTIDPDQDGKILNDKVDNSTWAISVDSEGNAKEKKIDRRQQRKFNRKKADKSQYEIYQKKGKTSRESMENAYYKAAIKTSSKLKDASKTNVKWQRVSERAKAKRSILQDAQIWSTMKEKEKNGTF